MNPVSYKPKDNFVLKEATMEGYTFSGWYDNANFTGEAVLGISKGSSGDKTFYAKWTPNQYTVIYSANKPSTASAAMQGITLDSTLTYDTPVNLRANGFLLQGWTFIGWNTEEDGSGILYANEEEVTNLSTGSNVTLFAQWTANSYKITYQNNKPINASGLLSGTMTDSSHIFDTASQLSTNAFQLVGWTFVGWNSKSNGTGEFFADLATITTGPEILYAQWVQNSYTLIYEKNKPQNASHDVTGEMNDTLCTYDEISILQGNAFALYGWTFGGWNTNADGTGSAYANGSNVTNLATANSASLYAQWVANTYTITFNKLGGNGGSDSVSAIYDSPMPVAFAPIQNGFTFAGYYTGTNGSGTKYYNSNMTSSKSWDIAANTTLCADWSENPYTVTFDKQGGSGGSNNVTAYYTLNMLSANAPNRIGFTFAGYFSEINGGGKKYYNSDMTSANTWDIAANATIYADWSENPYTVTFDKQGGSGGSNSVTAYYTLNMPSAAAPSRTGHTFDGYYSGVNGGGTKYYNSNMTSANSWNIAANKTLYANWTPNKYNVTFDRQGGAYGYGEVSATYGSGMPFANGPSRANYYFEGYWTGVNGTGVQYYNSNMTSTRNWDIASNRTLYAKWEPHRYSVTIKEYHISNALTIEESGGGSPAVVEDRSYTFDEERSFTFQDYQPTPPYAPIPGALYGKLSGLFARYLSNNKAVPKDKYTVSGNTITLKANCFAENEEILINAEYKNACVAEGTLITLADGSQKAVETLTGDELLLVWNLKTGTFDVAPILFIDSESTASYEVINLGFSDGTSVKVISEHGFWDFDLNKYVFLRSDAAKYIGHRFNKQTKDENGNLIWESVTLTSVTIKKEVTTAWSPVTYGHLCYYVNGMLSMPGATEGLINIFDVDPDTMKIDEAAYLADIAEYGLFTYEEFAENYPVPEAMFEAFGGKYLKVAMGKGLLTENMLENLILQYSSFLNGTT